MDHDHILIHLQNFSNYWHFIIIGQVDCHKLSHLNVFQAVIKSLDWVFPLSCWPVSSSIDLQYPNPTS